MKLHHLALRVADLGRSEAFYCGVLGMKLLARHERRAVWLEMGDAVLMLELELLPPGPSGSGHVLSLSVEDLSAWEERVAKAGVELLGRTPSTLFVADPDGHRVGLSTYDFG